MSRIEGTATGPDRWMPFLTIGVEMPGGRGNFTALVDSGADLTILPAELAEVFGIDFAALPPSAGPGQGVGGTFEIRIAQGRLTYVGVCFATEFAVAEKGHLPQPLLGRADFMRSFVVRFNWHKTPPEFYVDPVAVGAKHRK